MQPKQRNDVRLGIWLMIATSLVFAGQDGLSRHLAGEYNVLMVVMIRYWFFAAFVIAIARRQSGSLRAAARTAQPERATRSAATSTARSVSSTIASSCARERNHAPRSSARTRRASSSRTKRR